MPWEDEIKVFRFVNRVEDREDCTTGVANYRRRESAPVSRKGKGDLTYVFDTVVNHHIVKDLSSCFAEESEIVRC